MLIEVIAFGQDACSDQLLLEDIDEVEQVLGIAVADVIDRVRRQGQAVLADLALRRFHHHALDALDDIINIGEVALAVTIVEDLYALALDQLVGKSEVSHVGATRGTVNREETKSR